MDREWSVTETSFRQSSQGRPKVSFIACLYERDVDSLDRVQRRVTKMIDDGVGNKPMGTVSKNWGC